MTTSAITLRRTTSEDAEFRSLVVQLDADLAVRNGEEQSFFAAFNTLTTIREVVVCHEGGTPVGCGAFKEYGSGVAEIKRMFVLPSHRGRGIAGQVLRELEAWADECGFHTCILETGKKQPEAIRLYEKSGYHRIANYGQYAEVESSVCMEKHLR